MNPTPAELAAAMLGGLAEEFKMERYAYGFSQESRLVQDRLRDVVVISMVDRNTGRGYELEVVCQRVAGERRRGCRP